MSWGRIATFVFFIIHAMLVGVSFVWAVTTSFQASLTIMTPTYVATAQDFDFGHVVAGSNTEIRFEHDNAAQFKLVGQPGSSVIVMAKSSSVVNHRGEQLLIHQFEYGGGISKDRIGTFNELGLLNDVARLGATVAIPEEASGSYSGTLTLQVTYQ